MRDAGVDIAGGNNEPGLGWVSPERSRRNDGRHADGDDRHAHGPPVKGGAGVADAAAGDDPSVG